MLLRGNQTQAVNSGEHTHIIPESLACQNQIRHFFGERLQATNLWLFEEHCFCLNIYLRFSFGVWPMDDSTWCLGLAYCRQHDTLSSTHAASAETERHRTTEHKCTKIANFRENMFQAPFHECIANLFSFLYIQRLSVRIQFINTEMFVCCIRPISLRFFPSLFSLGNSLILLAHKLRHFNWLTDT